MAGKRGWRGLAIVVFFLATIVIARIRVSRLLDPSVQSAAGQAGNTTVKAGTTDDGDKGWPSEPRATPAPSSDLRQPRQQGQSIREGGAPVFAVSLSSTSSLLATPTVTECVNGGSQIAKVRGTTAAPGCGAYLPLVVSRWPRPAPTATPQASPTATGAFPPQVAGCDVFPADNVWNAPVDTLPVDANSAAYINTIGADRYFHADFGSGEWPPGSGSPIGIPFMDVPGTQPKVPVSFTYADESDPGPYPIPTDVPIEGGPNSDGDRHVLVVDRDACVLYELFDAWPQPDGSWTAGSGAVFDLKSNALRPAGWTSADAAGLPILPGLVRYDEVASGEVRHAIRFTAPQTRRAYVWPARHFASSLTGTQYPPMGERFRLKASFDEAGFSPEVRVILRAMKKYGIILADNGAAWFISGVPDDRWNNDVLHELHQVHGSDFEAVDESSLMVNPDSGQVR